MKITISTLNHQVKTYDFDEKTLLDKDWNRVMRDVILTEKYYDQTRKNGNEAGE